MAPLTAQLDAALAARAALLDARHETGCRLFAGFYEGCPELVVDVVARTLVLHDYADPPAAGDARVAAALAFYRERLPWLRCAVRKPRAAVDPAARAGRVVGGTAPDRCVLEHGVRYAVDLLLNRDASFYLDTRLLREWLRTHLAGRTVLNLFAYTGQLGAAALAGGAARVVQLDRNRAFLQLARRTYRLNGLAADPADFLAADFWVASARLRRARRTFDCVILDPPFFARSPRGTIDMQRAPARLIAKVRPLVANGGFLVVVNNAVFLPGAEYWATLQALAQDGYLTVAATIPVPPDVTGYPATRVTPPPVDPSPFNHPTKIAVLRLHRKGPGPTAASP